MIRKLVLLLLFLAIVIRPTFEIIRNSNKFFDRSYEKRYETLKKQYYSSQYVVKKNSIILIDEGFEAFAGGAFLKGMNPILIVHDHPPLGRYIVSLSIIVFDNENTIIILLFFSSLLGTFLISKMILDNTIFSLLPVVIFSNESLIFSKIQFTPLPEIIQLPFIIFCLLFFMLYIKTKKMRYAVLTSLFLGCIISIRFFVLGGVLLFSFLIFFFLKRKLSEFLRFSITLPLSLFILYVSYVKSIQDSNSILEPLRIQKYILSYHGGKFIQFGTVWDLILFNRWHTWWGDRLISRDPNWNLFWPISIVLSSVLAVLGVIKKVKLKDTEIILILWSACYLIMLSAGSVSVRYFVPLLPFLYILSFALLYRIKAVQKFLKKI